jgi:nucleoside-diphosphate-sugar epimerase
MIETDNFFQQKTVMVTGGAGFLGSHICDRLLKAGAKVVAVDNFLTGRIENLAHLLNEDGQSQNPNFTFIKADVITDPKSYLPADFKVDLILHFASPASPPRYQAHPKQTYLVNSYATHLLLEYLVKTNPQGRFLFASTSEIYGDPEQHPQPESYWGNVNPNGIRSCYDEAKRLGETICGVFERDSNIDARIVRIFNTYGPRIDPDDGRVIPNFIAQALVKKPLNIYGDGSQTRSYCYVDDLIEGILRLASFDGLKGQTVNIGNSKEYTVLQTAQIIQELINGSCSDDDFEYLELPKDDPTRRKPDISKAKQLLDWQPQINFKEGLKKTIEYFK